MLMLEPIEAPLENRAKEALGSDDEMLIRASTDFDSAGRFGRQWIIVTRIRLLVVSEGDGSTLTVPIEQISRVRSEPLVGGGRLEIERHGEPTLLVSYTDSHAVKFSEIARGLEQLRKGEEFLIDPRIDRLRCDRCNRLLPEKDGICPACIKKGETLLRIARYLSYHPTRSRRLCWPALRR